MQAVCTPGENVLYYKKQWENEMGGVHMAAMSAEQRRRAVAALLEQADGPVSATALARRFSVSRQIIVGDVALLRAGGADISATPRGYVAGRGGPGLECKVACVHAPEEMGRELTAIVDAGGEAVDVIVEHGVYGQLTGALRIRSRHDVEQFLRRVEEREAKPLSDLTGGIHLHTIRCPDQATLDRVLEALDRQGFLLHMQ